MQFETDQVGKTPGTPTKGVKLVHISRRVYLMLVGAVIAPWLIAVGFYQIYQKGGFSTTLRPLHTAGIHAPVGTYSARPGPWGELEFSKIFIEPPDDFISIRPDDYGYRDGRWVFAGKTREQVMDVFQKAGLSEAQLVFFRDEAKWYENDTGSYVVPSDELLYDLTPEARRQIYAVLARSSHNVLQLNPYSFLPAQFEERFARSGLKPEIVELVRHYLYPHGNILLFSDVRAVMKKYEAPEDRLKLMRSLARRSTLLATLHLTPESNVDELAKYWGQAGRAKSIRSLLESGKSVPSGVRLDVAHLMPAFARTRLYTYPFPSMDPLDSRMDCNWTTFNFFATTPTSTTEKPSFYHSIVKEQYFPVVGEPQYGDVVFIARPDNVAVHSAIYIADNVVFTKNSGHYNQPWMLMTIDELVAEYDAIMEENEDPKVLFFRNRNY